MAIVGHCQAARKVDPAVLLASFFWAGAQSWTSLQAHYDTELAKERVGTEFLAEIRRHALPA